MLFTFLRKLELWIDNEGKLEEEIIAPRSIRSEELIELRTRIMIYIGGDENSPLFKGCIKQIYVDKLAKLCYRIKIIS